MNGTESGKKTPNDKESMSFPAHLQVLEVLGDGYKICIYIQTYLTYLQLFKFLKFCATKWEEPYKMLLQSVIE